MDNRQAQQMHKKNRPVYLNLFQFRFPVTAVMSIGHRLSGLFLFLALPFVLLALQLSLHSQAEFDSVLYLLSLPAVKVLLVLLLWSLVHHLLAGIRYLLIDMDVAVSRLSARYNAWSVFALEAVLLTVLLVYCL